MAAPNGEHPTHSRVKDDDIVPAYLVKGSSLLERRFRRSVLSEGLPTLTRLSAQRLYVTRIKSEDPRINTVSLSVLVLPGMNADYDGRALPSLNSLNCWKLLRAWFTKAESETINVMV